MLFYLNLAGIDTDKLRMQGCCNRTAFESTEKDLG